VVHNGPGPGSVTITVMKRPSLLCYNDINGEEMGQILMQRFQEIVQEVPSFKAHLTFPRMKARITVEIITEADDPNAYPVLGVVDLLEIQNRVTLTTEIDASPTGDPPDKVRLDHGIQPYEQVRTFDSTGRAISIADKKPEAETIPPVFRISEPSKEGYQGVVVDRTGTSPIRANAVVITQDPGPAGLARPDGGSVNNRYTHSIKPFGTPDRMEPRK